MLTNKPDFIKMSVKYHVGERSAKIGREKLKLTVIMLQHQPKLFSQTGNTYKTQKLMITKIISSHVQRIKQ